jgi:hypothetical protein
VVTVLVLTNCSTPGTQQSLRLTATATSTVETTLTAEDQHRRDVEEFRSYAPILSNIARRSDQSNTRMYDAMDRYASIAGRANLYTVAMQNRDEQNRLLTQLPDVPG